MKGHRRICSKTYTSRVGKVVVDVHRPFGEQPCRLKGGRSFSESSPLPFSSCSRRNRAPVRIPFARSPPNWLPARIPHPALHDRYAPPLADRYRTRHAARAGGDRANPASASSRPCVPNRMDGGRWRAPSVGHARLSAPGRGEHRPSPRGAAARRPRAHAADSISSRRGRGGLCSRHSRALPASLSARPLDQRVRSRRRQHGAADAGLQCHDRLDGGRHRRRKGSRPCAVLHLAAGSQRLQGRRGAEARGRPRRDLSGHGR